MQFNQAQILFFFLIIAAIYLFTVDKKQDEIHELHEIKTGLKSRKLAGKSLW